jgi:ankyrin repeat protein
LFLSTLNISNFHNIVKHNLNYLLELDGNDPNKKTHDSRNYLHWGAYASNVHIVNALLKAGSSVTQLDSNGNTPLTFCRKCWSERLGDL